MEIPEFFTKGKDHTLNPIRLLYNSKKYKYYHVITYIDHYQAYTSANEFKAAGRLPFEFNKTMRMFTIEKSFKKLRNHGEGTFLTFSTIEDHHTIKDWIVTREWMPLVLMYRKSIIDMENKKHVELEVVDEFLSVKREWIDDSHD